MAPKKSKKKEAEVAPSILDLNVQSNSEKFKDELNLLCSSAQTTIMVRSRELHRTCEFIFEYSVTQQAPKTIFNVWTITEGWRSLATDAIVPNTTGVLDGLYDPNNPTSMLADIRNPEYQPEYSYSLYPQGVQGDGSFNPAIAIDVAVTRLLNEEHGSAKHVNVMFAPEYWFEAPDFQEQIRAFSDKAMGYDCRLILLCNEQAELPSNLQNNVKILDFLAPNAPELYEECIETLSSITISEDETIEFDEHQIAAIVQNGLGMSVFEFNSALTRGIVKQTEDEGVETADDLDHSVIIQTIIEQKSEVVRKSQCLELIQPIDIAKVGGLDLLKDYLTKRKRAFSSEARKFGVDAPRGIMCCGVPGTGKSLIAKSASYIFDIPCAGFDIGKVFGGLVGQSESQMRGALAQIEAMAPCVLYMDEVDKGLSGMGSAGGDGGTSARVFGTLLTWMQERKADAPPVYVIMTANNVENLPPELLRKGRLDEIFYLTFPGKEERRQIFNIHLNSRGHELEDKELDRVLDATEDFVGAEIEGVVKDAILEAFNSGMDAPTGELLLKFAKKVKTLSTTFPEKITKMNDWAKNNASPASSPNSVTRRPDEPSPKKTIVRPKGKVFKPRGNSPIRN